MRQTIHGFFSTHLPKARSILSFLMGPVLGIASGPILARALAPEGRGQFAAVMQPISVGGAIASLGVPAAVTYYAAKGFNPRKTFTTGVIVALVPSTLVYIGMALYAFPVGEVQGISALILIGAWAAVFPSALVQIRRGVWQGVAGWAILDAERAAFALLRFAAVTAVALLGASFAGWYVLAALIAFLAASLPVWRPLPERVFSEVNLSTKSFASYSLAASIGTVSLIANNRLDQVLFPAAGSTLELGFYAVAVTVAEVPLVLGTLAARNALTESVIDPSIRRVGRSAAPFVLSGLLVTGVISVAAPVVVPIVFGREFQPAVEAMEWLCLGTAFSMIGLVLNAYISGVGRPGIASLIPLGALLTTCVGFAVRWGTMTSTLAAQISMVSQGVALVLGALVIARLGHGVRGSFALRTSKRRKVTSL